MPLPRRDEKYTYADYCTWDAGDRWELIEGVPYAMSPAPTQAHQEISGQLFRRIGNFPDGTPCKAFHAPFDVRLNAAGDDDTVCRPDLLVVCDCSKLDGTCCKGAPDFVAEILSPSTARRDRWTKYNLYRDAGITEYWIADPDTKTVSVNVLHDGEYIFRAYADTDIAPVSVLPGLEIDLSGVFM